jgi:hypothetical protein
MMRKKEKYIVAKFFSMGYNRISCTPGTIIDVNRDKSVMMINGSEYQDLRDIDIALRIKGSLVIPYDESNPEIKKILDGVKAKLAVKEVETAGMPIVMSDRDLVGDIDISYTKIPEKKVADKKSSMKMEVIKESEASLPIANRVEEELKNRIESVYNRPKMRVVKEGEDTGTKTISESAKAKTRAPKSSITLRKKG